MLAPLRVCVLPGGYWSERTLHSLRQDFEEVVCVASIQTPFVASPVQEIYTIDCGASKL